MVRRIVSLICIYNVVCMCEDNRQSATLDDCSE
jgi:hypothetical protein